MMSVKKAEIRKVTYMCQVCGKTHEMPVQQYMAEGEYNGEKVDYLRTVYYCSNIDEEFTPSDAKEQNLMYMKASYNRKKRMEDTKSEKLILCANCRKKVTYQIKRRAATTVIEDVEIPYEES